MVVDRDGDDTGDCGCDAGVDGDGDLGMEFDSWRLWLFFYVGWWVFSLRGLLFVVCWWS